MAVCQSEDAPPRELIARAPRGQINAKGDCEFAEIGVSCHYHAGEEFVSSATQQQTPGEGELHCIFSSSDPKRPRVFGAHVVCRDHARGEPHGELSHDVHAGAACSADLLRDLEPCNERRCCDSGTLTNPIAELEKSHRNDIRPDFRICQDTLELDCDLGSAHCPARQLPCPRRRRRARLRRDGHEALVPLARRSETRLKRALRAAAPSS